MQTKIYNAAVTCSRSTNQGLMGGKSIVTYGLSHIFLLVL